MDHASEEAVRATVTEFLTAARHDKGQVACSLLTDDGASRVLLLAGGRGGDCKAVLSRDSAGPAPPNDRQRPTVDPIGVAGEFALAIVKSEEASLVWTLREVGGRWLIDLPGPLPEPDTLPEGGADDEAGQAAQDYLDARSEMDEVRLCSLLSERAFEDLTRSLIKGPGLPGLSPEEIRELSPTQRCERHYSAFSGLETPVLGKVVSVGDVALAYEENGPPFLLVLDPDGWRVDESSLGLP